MHKSIVAACTRASAMHQVLFPFPFLYPFPFLPFLVIHPAVWIIEVSDNRDSDNRGCTVHVYVMFTCMYIHVYMFACEL